MSCVLLCEAMYIPVIAVLGNDSFEATKTHGYGLRYFSMAAIALYTLGPIVFMLRLTFHYLPYESDPLKYRVRVQTMTAMMVT